MILLPYKCRYGQANAVISAYGRRAMRVTPFFATRCSRDRAVSMPAKDEATMFFKAAALLLGFAFITSAWFVLSASLAHSRGSPTMLLVKAGPPPEPARVADESNDQQEYPAGEENDEKLFPFPLILNDSVEGELEYLTESGREIFQDWLNRSARYVPLIKKIFREYNLPEDLAYLAMIESGFNPHAVSPRHAAGLWQFMAPTGRGYGLITNQWIDERKDPVKSTYAAAAHLKDLYNLFGSWPLVLASYNAGMGTVRGVVHRARSDDYWDLRASKQFRQETRNYVPRYLAALIIARSPEAYGFVVPHAEPFAYDEIVVRQSTDLSEAARVIGCSVDDILELNPELIRKSTPPQQWYVLRIPPGTKSFYELRVAKLLRELRSRGDRKDEGLAVLPSFVPSASAPDSILGAAGFERVMPIFGAQFALADDDITCMDCSDIPLFLHQVQYRVNEEQAAAF
jgi:hypothetical protein